MTSLIHVHALGLLLWTAQSAPGGAAPPDGTEDRVADGRFFRMTIDFWKSGPKKVHAAALSDPAPEGPRESIWAEPVRQPDGRYSIYVPPRPVLDFLENPSPENLKGYLEWKRARAEKLRRAIELLEEYRAKEEALRPKENRAAESAGPSGGDAPTAPRAPIPLPVAPTPGPAADDAAAKGLEIIYFHGKGCPHCTKQDRILAEWLAAHPDVSVRVLELGESPELWLKYRVRGTPSLLLSSVAGEPGVLLEGLSDAARLDQGLAALRRTPPPAKPPPPPGPDPTKERR